MSFATPADRSTEIIWWNALADKSLIGAYSFNKLKKFNSRLKLIIVTLWVCDGASERDGEMCEARVEWKRFRCMSNQI